MACRSGSILLPWLVVAGASCSRGVVAGASCSRSVVAGASCSRSVVAGASCSRSVVAGASCSRSVVAGASCSRSVVAGASCSRSVVAGASCSRSVVAGASCSRFRRLEAAATILHTSHSTLRLSPTAAGSRRYCQFGTQPTKAARPHSKQDSPELFRHLSLVKIFSIPARRLLVQGLQLTDGCHLTPRRRGLN